MSFDEFFNGVEIHDLNISPDGRAVIIETSRADWEQEVFRRELWLWREESGLRQLTRSGHDNGADWSPDGKWIAFYSDRKQSSDKSDAPASEEPPTQVYVISTDGGEAFPVTSGEEEMHAFAWSADSTAIYFATTQPLTKEQKEAQKKDWHDVNRWREAERGELPVVRSFTHSGEGSGHPPGPPANQHPAWRVSLHGDACTEGARVPRTHLVVGSTPTVSTART